MASSSTHSYTLYIELATRTHAGDITITDGAGRFYTFSYGVGAWQSLTRSQREAAIGLWLNDALPGQFNLKPLDVQAILRAAVYNKPLPVTRSTGPKIRGEELGKRVYISYLEQCYLVDKILSDVYGEDSTENYAMARYLYTKLTEELPDDTDHV